MQVLAYRLSRLLHAIARLKEQRTLSTVAEMVAQKLAGPGSTILRCDVERDLDHHLRFAQRLAEMGVRSTMYFHTRRSCFNPTVLREIQDLGHEVGYHHECLDRCHGDWEAAKELFLREVDLFRRHGLQLSTVCGHGEAGLPKNGYHTTRDLFLKYPKLLDEAGVLAEVYHWRSKQPNQLYASDTFSNYPKLFPSLTAALRSDDPIMVLIHPHRWRDEMGTCLHEIMADLQQHLKNRLLGQRSYDVVS